jgi:beta-barrel assembly-enhancing protease
VQIEAKLKNANLDLMGQLLRTPLEFWQAGYNKDEEFEADREGARLAVTSGYSPYGAVTLFTRLAKLCNEYVIHAQSPEQELSELAIQSLTGYFRSHPLPSERLDQINRLIAEEHWENRQEQKPFHVEYEVHNGQFVK